MLTSENEKSRQKAAWDDVKLGHYRHSLCEAATAATVTVFNRAGQCSAT